MLSPRGDGAGGEGDPARNAHPNPLAGVASSALRGASSLAGSASTALRGASRLPGLAAREAFVRSGVKGPEDVRAPTGLGGFEVSYDPAQMIEFVRIGGAVEFRNAIEIRDGKAVANVEGVKTVADQLNKALKHDLPALLVEVAKWQWQEGDKAAWLARLESAVESAWDRQFLFHAQAEGFEGIEALTSVDVDAHPGPMTPRDHLVIEVFRTPAESDRIGSRLQYGQGGPKDNHMILGSTDVGGRPKGFDRVDVGFAAGTVELDAAGRSELEKFSITFKGVSGSPARVSAFVQGEGDRPYDCARQRFDEMQMYLDAFGFDRQRLEFRYAGPGSSASLRVGEARGQVIAAHEFGHQAGLMDEYAVDEGGAVDGRTGPAGPPSGHDALAKSVGLEGSVIENRDSLMSLGAALQPSYGAPFLWALRKVTRMDAWGDSPPSRGPRDPGEGA